MSRGKTPRWVERLLATGDLPLDEEAEDVQVVAREENTGPESWDIVGEE